MGKEAAEVGFREGSEVCRVAAGPAGTRVAGGRTDGSVWIADLAAQGVRELTAASGTPISALALSADGGRVAYGDEAGRAGVIDV